MELHPDQRGVRLIKGDWILRTCWELRYSVWISEVKFHSTPPLVPVKQIHPQDHHCGVILWLSRPTSASHDTRPCWDSSHNLCQSPDGRLGNKTREGSTSFLRQQISWGRKGSRHDCDEMNDSPRSKNCPRILIDHLNLDLEAGYYVLFIHKMYCSDSL
jgi:hypothetical protein